MKPRKLTLINIGPFVGKHIIDFSSLESIYVITGKTGSGKTTLLDALTYALYGKLPGARQDVNNKFLRSHYCLPEDECKIVLEFSLLDKTYKIERTPPNEKRNKKGEQKTIGEVANLYWVKKENTASQPDLFSTVDNEELLSGQKSTVDKTLQDLLGLTIEEFSRIVLLPQGEFSTFLRQNTSERKKILAKLFPVDIFTKITEKAKQQRDFYKKDLESITKRLEQLTEDFNPETAEEELQALKNQQETEKSEFSKVQKKLEQLSKEEERLTLLAKKYEELQTIQSKLTELESQKDMYSEKEKKLTLANEVDKILPLVQHYEEFSKKLEQTTLDLEHYSKQLTQCTKEKDTIETQESEKKLWEVQFTKNNQNIPQLENALGLEKSITQNSVEKEKFTNNEVQITKELLALKVTIEELQKTIEQEESIQEQLASLIENNKLFLYKTLLCEHASIKIQLSEKQFVVEKEQAILETLNIQLEEQKTTNLALSLAKQVKEGCPCPLCGSLDHPNIAKSENNNLDLEKNIETQKVLVQTENTQLQKLQNSLISIETKLDIAKKDISSINDEIKIENYSTIEEYNVKIQEFHANTEQNKKRIQETQSILDSIQRSKTQKIEIEKKQEPLAEKKQSITNELVRINERILQATQQLEILRKTIPITNSLHDTISAIKQEQHELTQRITYFNTIKENNANQLASLTATTTIIKKNLEENNANVEKSFNKLFETITSASFYTEGELSNTIEFVKNSFINDIQKKAIRTSIETYNSQCTSTKAILKQLETELEHQDNSLLEQQEKLTTCIEQSKQKQHEIQKTLEQTQEKLINLTKDFTLYQQEQKAFETTKKELEKITLLHSAISGDNAKKLPLDAWILSMHLQDIVLQANSRLKRLSNDRYQLSVKTEGHGGNGYKGLDLEIFDQYTGKARPTNSLSGGETFMTAICLALAISDLVQEQNGGVQLDSMFIDEGFGSLDPESLEAALSILDEIRETRSIGLISHVELLQTRIPSQIAVTKTNIGSTVKVL